MTRKWLTLIAIMRVGYEVFSFFALRRTAIEQKHLI
jgi:hypothetical protein